jgi:ligand-binding sensor domain-containing protein/two-component sensor histidine kinase
MLRILYLMFFSLLVITAGAQDYNYIQYTVADGLPSNTVYDVKQDTDGFIWLATDAGLVRFDGRKFITFTRQDGLPSNDVLMLQPDKKGRLWLLLTHNTVCYHYKGKIYNYKNDSICSKLSFQSSPYYIAENGNGDIAIVGWAKPGGPSIYLVKSNNEILEARHPQPQLKNCAITPGFEPDEFTLSYIDTAGKKSFHYLYDGQLQLWITTTWDQEAEYLRRYEMINGKLTVVDSKRFRKPSNFTMKEISRNGEMEFYEQNPMAIRIGTALPNWNEVVYQSTADGVHLNDPVTGKLYVHLLPDKVANRCFVDREKNLWIGTNTEGIWVLPSMSINNITFSQPKVDILSFYKEGNRLFAGSAYGHFFQIQNKKAAHYNFDRYIPLSNNRDANNRLHWIEPVSDGLVLGFDDFLLKYDPATDKELFYRSDVIKSMHKAGKDSLLVATGRATLLFNTKTMAILDTVYPWRSHSSVKLGNAFYIGATAGVMKITPGLPAIALGDLLPDLKTLVNRMEKATDGSLWMSTAGNGVIRLRNDSIIQKFNIANGLTSNNCKSMYLDEKFVWVGTENGLNRIDRLHPSAPVQQYTIEDGLPSNDIHSLLSDSGKVYIGTSGKISFFDTSSIRKPSFCALRLLSMEAAKQAVNPDSLSPLRYNENTLKFEYTGISFSSPKNITYYYRLKGQSDSWDSTRNTNLEFVALPPGDYTLEIFAKNKSRVNSNTLSIPFIIQPPFWGTWWFRLLVTGILVALVWWLVLRRIRQEQAKSATQNRINELEQLALRSQMNPHFIFNCLNSIQNFLLQSNFEKTNEYLTSFAHLIRQTLDNSSRSSISLENECRYLSSYLELESMRFGHSFLYDIEVDPDIDTNNTFIPTMILQPYVENSIRHGLRYRQDGVKTVKIVFRKRGNTMVCIVEDNGIGRKKAAEMKSFIHVEYQSKGMTLTAERIAALNRRQDIPITVDVIDMEEDGNATGTQVIVRIPNVFL